MGEASKSYYSNKVSLVFAQFDLRLAFFEINPRNAIQNPLKRNFAQW